MEMYGLSPCWQKQSMEQKKSIIAKLLDQLEVSNKVLRMKAARCFLYLAQVSCKRDIFSEYVMFDKFG